MENNNNQAIIATSRSMVQSLGLFVLINPHIQSAADASTELKTQTFKLESLIKKYFELEDIVPLEPVREKIDTDVSSELGKLKKGAFDLAALAFFIPLLLNKDAREYFANFLKGLTGIESLDTLRNTVLTIAGLVGGFFAYKFIGQITEALKAMTKLSAAVAALFGLNTLLGSRDSGLEAPDTDKKPQQGKQDRPASGGIIPQADKEKEERRKRREKRVEKLKKYRAGIKALTSAGRVAGPLALGAMLVDATVSTVLDIAEKEDDEWDTGQALNTFTKNVIESATFGLINKNTIDNTVNVISGKEETKKQNLQAISGMSVYGAEFSGFESKSSEITPSVQLPPSPVLDNNVSMGKQVVEKSEKVSSMKKEINVTPKVVVTNIDNSTVLIDNTTDYSNGSDGFFVSSSVGR